MSSRKVQLDQEAFLKGTIAQDDDGNYSESGYVVVALGDGQYCMFSYAHCSCFDTWDSLEKTKYGNGLYSVVPLWVGTEAELRKLSKWGGDPTMPDRLADQGDSDYDHLMEVYKQVNKHFDAIDNNWSRQIR